MMNNKILLAAVFGKSAALQFEEVGICSIASFLRTYGYEVMLMEVAEDYVDYNRICRYGPGIVGVTIYDSTKDAAYRFCRKVRQQLPETYICAGGYYSTYSPEQLMEESPFIDFIIRGEGELAFWELLKSLEEGRSLEGVESLVYRKGSEIVINEKKEFIKDLDVLPFPSRDIFHANKLKFALVSTSRGCTGNCSFCVARDFWGSWRGRDIPKVLEEIKILYNQGIRFIHFIDNSFEDPGSDFTRLEFLIQGMIDLNLGIVYSADFRAEFYKRADPRLMNLLKRSGMRAAMIGIEAGYEFDLRLYGKRAVLDDNHKVVEHFRNHDIFVKIGFINFNPYSSFENLSKNIDYLERHGFAGDFQLLASRYNAYKGIRLYEKTRADGLLRKPGESSKNTPGRKDFGYNFQERRLEDFFSYMDNYFGLFEHSPGLGYWVFYIRFYPMVVSNFKIDFENVPRHREAYQVVLEHEQSMQAVFDQLNTTMAQWFRELLRLSERGWDRKEADMITENLLSLEYLQRAVSRLDQLKNQFFSTFASLGAEYKSLFLKSFSVISG